MKIEKLIQQLQALQKEMPGAEVRLNDKDGTEALFAVAINNVNGRNSQYANIVWIEGKDDIDLGEEIFARFQNAAESQMDELDFFMELTNTGITLHDIKQHVPEVYEYSKRFISCHG